MMHNDAVFCTEEMRVSAIEVKYKDGKSYILDSVKSFIKTTDGLKDVSLVKDFNDTFFQYYQETGTYPVTGDALLNRLPDFVRPTKWNDTQFIGKIEFVGYKKDKELFRKTIKAYTDACHVYCDEKDLAPIILE